MDAITFQQTPVYRANSSGGIVQSGSIPAGKEILITKVDLIISDNRQIGFLPTGEFVYMDSISTILDNNIQVKDKRLWDWLIGLIIVIIILSISAYFATR